MNVGKYTSKALDALKSRPAAYAGEALRYGGLLAGAIAGGLAYQHTGGDAVAATHAMVSGAALFAGGEVIRAARDFAIDGIGNVYSLAGRAVSVAAPIAGAIFLGDNSYQPALDLGPVAAWGAGQLPRQIGDRLQERETGYRILRQQGRDAAMRVISVMPDDKLAATLGRLVRKNR